ncbi:MAG: hypothetical protein KBT27_02615 [Prevotellaceae bacterium]|nr:hypothetical protein [Candidatus Faecinaster equi]
MKKLVVEVDELFCLLRCISKAHPEYNEIVEEFIDLIHDIKWREAEKC